MTTRGLWWLPSAKAQEGTPLPNHTNRAKHRSPGCGPRQSVSLSLCQNFHRLRFRVTWLPISSAGIFRRSRRCRVSSGLLLRSMAPFASGHRRPTYPDTSQQLLCLCHSYHIVLYPNLLIAIQLCTQTMATKQYPPLSCALPCP